MLEPLQCGTCPKCRADTVLALRTAQDRNECHCSTCHHVWYEEPAAVSLPDPGPVNVRVKPDRRKRPY